MVRWLRAMVTHVEVLDTFPSPPRNGSLPAIIAVPKDPKPSLTSMGTRCAQSAQAYT